MSNELHLEKDDDEVIEKMLKNRQEYEDELMFKEDQEEEAREEGEKRKAESKHKNMLQVVAEIRNYWYSKARKKDGKGFHGKGYFTLDYILNMFNPVFDALGVTLSFEVYSDEYGQQKLISKIQDTQERGFEDYKFEMPLARVMPSNEICKAEVMIEYAKILTYTKRISLTTMFNVAEIDELEEVGNKYTNHHRYKPISAEVARQEIMKLKETAPKSYQNIIDYLGQPKEGKKYSDEEILKGYNYYKYDVLKGW